MIASTYTGNRSVTLNLAVGDIEEAIARCGWTILNGTSRTPDEQAEIDRIEAQGYAAMRDETVEEAMEWWTQRVCQDSITFGTLIKGHSSRWGTSYEIAPSDTLGEE